MSCSCNQNKKSKNVDFWQSIIQKHKKKIADLSQRKLELTRRLEVQKCAVPACLYFSMMNNSAGNAGTALKTFMSALESPVEVSSGPVDIKCMCKSPPILQPTLDKVGGCPKTCSTKTGTQAVPSKKDTSCQCDKCTDQCPKCAEKLQKEMKMVVNTKELEFENTCQCDKCAEIRRDNSNKGDTICNCDICNKKVTEQIKLIAERSANRSNLGKSILDGNPICSCDICKKAFGQRSGGPDSGANDGYICSCNICKEAREKTSGRTDKATLVVPGTDGRSGQTHLCECADCTKTVKDKLEALSPKRATEPTEMRLTLDGKPMCDCETCKNALAQTKDATVSAPPESDLQRESKHAPVCDCASKKAVQPASPASASELKKRDHPCACKNRLGSSSKASRDGGVKPKCDCGIKPGEQPKDVKPEEQKPVEKCCCKKKMADGSKPKCTCKKKGTNEGQAPVTPKSSALDEPPTKCRCKKKTVEGELKPKCICKKKSSREMDKKKEDVISKPTTPEGDGTAQGGTKTKCCASKSAGDATKMVDKNDKPPQATVPDPASEKPFKLKCCCKEESRDMFCYCREKSGEKKADSITKLLDEGVAPSAPPMEDEWGSPQKVVPSAPPMEHDWMTPERVVPSAPPMEDEWGSPTASSAIQADDSDEFEIKVVTPVKKTNMSL